VARVQYRDGTSRTDVLAAYQDKFFGWPNLYTPFNFRETESLQTTLFLVQHDRTVGAGGRVGAAAAFRRNRDDYEVDRTRPGLSNPFQHETRVLTGTLSAAVEAAGLTWEARVLGMRDAIDSTALTFGRFRTRTYGQAVVEARGEEGLGGGTLAWRGGAVWDDTDRDPSALSPVVEARWLRGGWGVGVGYGEATQVAGYTALNSNPAAGLFRGNPDLGRARARTWEVDAQRSGTLAGGTWDAGLAVFHRRDRGMTDWTFRFASPNARTANRLDADTLGTEAVVRARWDRVAVVAGWSWLEKDADYGGAPVDASYYALNFPRHRVTLAVLAEVFPGVQLRLDNEWREQERNALRRSARTAFLTTAGIGWRVPGVDGLELEALVENVWDERFEEVPAVPGAPRTWSVGAAWRW
jgi:hypothetical protein